MDIFLAPFNFIGDIGKTIVGIPNKVIKSTERTLKPLTKGVGKGINNVGKGIGDLGGSLKGITQNLPLIGIVVVAIILIKK